MLSFCQNPQLTVSQHLSANLWISYKGSGSCTKTKEDYGCMTYDMSPSFSICSVSFELVVFKIQPTC